MYVIKNTILYVGGFILPDRNAAAQRVVSIAKILRDLNYNVIFLNRSPYALSREWKETEYYGFKCFEQKKKNSKVELVHELWDIDFVKSYVSKIGNVSAIIAYNFPAGALKNLIIFCRLKNIKCIGDVTEWYGSKGRSFAYKIIKGIDIFYRMRILQKKLDGIIAISDFLEGYYSRCTKVVNLPPLVDKQDPKWNCQVKEHAGVQLIYAGSPSSEKERLDLITEAVLELHEKYDVKLKVIGITREQFLNIYSWNEEKITNNKNISFLGRLPHEEVVKQVSSADYSILIRDKNRANTAGFPTKFVESISCDTAVLANKNSCISKYFVDGKNGFLISENNIVEDLENVLIRNQKIKVEKDLFDYRNYTDLLREFMSSVLSPKKKVALHIIMPNQTSGPNTANRLIGASYLKGKYDFCFIKQEMLSGGRINITLLKKLIRQIKDEDPDLLHFSGLQSSGFHAVLAARLAGKKNILVTIRGYAGDAIGLNFFKKFLFEKIFEPLTLSLSRYFYTVCHEAGERKMVKKHLKKYIGVIPNAAPNISDHIKDRLVVRDLLGIEKDDFAVVVVGRMVYDKGISYIIDAITKVEDPKIKFVFIGDGPYEEILNQRFKDLKNVICLGKRSDVVEIVNSCDLFLFATLHENLSNALLEAMACGLPIVATRVGGNIDVVEDGANGFLVAPSNSQEIVERVTQIAHNEELHNKFSKRSKDIIKEKFSQCIVYAKISELYDRMLEMENRNV